MAILERELGSSGPILSDGTAIGELVDIERREASLRLFSDPEVFRHELRLLFAKAWIVVGHETEIPEAGDFRLRQIGKDAVILTRDRDGAVRVLLNVCTHRGMQICRAEFGNTTTFKCAYHGWVFANEGNLLGAPFEQEMYGDAWDKREYSLRQARVETYAGFVFANWSAEAPGLDEFLGEYRWYLDTIFKRSKRGLEMLGAPQRFVIKANWKTASEQFNGADGYHAVTLHRSLMDAVGAAAGIDYQTLCRAVLAGVDIGSPQGHGLRCIDMKVRVARYYPSLTNEEYSALDPIEILERVPPQSMPPELVHELRETMSPAQLRAMTTYAPGPGGMFPNIGFDPTQLRTFVPLAPDRFEMLNWPLVEKDASPEFRRQAMKSMLSSLGTSGTIEQDDAEAWPGVQASAEGVIGSEEAMRYRGFTPNEPPEPGWGGGAETYTGFSKDDSAWNWWKRYRDYLTGQPW